MTGGFIHFKINFNKEAFQSNANGPLADTCLGYLVNKFNIFLGRSHVTCDRPMVFGHPPPRGQTDWQIEWQIDMTENITFSHRTYVVVIITRTCICRMVMTITRSGLTCVPGSCGACTTTCGNQTMTQKDFRWFLTPEGAVSAASPPSPLTTAQETHRGSWAIKLLLM